MPTYEFVCPSGHTFNKFFRKISDAPGELPCTDCGQAATRKISGGAGLVFKGSGFYITDYGKDGKKAERAAAKAGDGAGAKGAEGKGAGEGGSGTRTESKSGGGEAPATKSSTAGTSSSTSSSGE